MTTKQELLTVAKTLNISGRHDMSKKELAARIRKEQRVNAAGNKPYQYKFYAAGDNVNFEKANKQVTGILKAAQQLTAEQGQYIGKEVVQFAINHGFVKTKIEPDVLYAYYARELERRGVIFVGYGVMYEPKAKIAA